MSYQVLARKWRPQRFDDVVGQKGVTQTLRNAIGSGRLAQAFVFAGARGVGKTTTARILARALNCEQGPTAEPCGRCDMCVEIAEGRDLDVLEIDAATHTGVDNVRDVIIDGLAIRPVRDRYKIFIIDEVHQLSNSSFNALLKSMEEPPPHVVFMMATTELHKIPDTILSRAQVYEFRTIGTRAIADQLRTIADAEQVTVDDAALMLVARAAEGSMRDAQSAFDQVLAFGGTRIDVEQVSMVLGLVARDLLLEIAETVAREDAPGVFDLAARVVETGQDMKHVCRELARLVRDLMILQIDPARTADPEYAVEGDRARLEVLAAAFSREDLLRAFDLIAKLETDLRSATQPRYHLEMALLRWIHLRQLVPIADLIDAVERNAPLPGRLAGVASSGSARLAPPPASAPGGAGSVGAGPAGAGPGGAGPGGASRATPASSLVTKLEARIAPRPAAGASDAPASAAVPPAPAPTAAAPAAAAPAAPAPASSSAAPSPRSSAPSSSAPTSPASTPSAPTPSASKPSASSSSAPTSTSSAAPASPAKPGPSAPAPAPSASSPSDGGSATPPASASASGGTTSPLNPAFAETFLAEVKRAKQKFVYNTLIHPVRRVDVADHLITFVFPPRPATLQAQFEQQRPSLEEIATKIAGRPMRVTTVEEREAAPAAGKPSAGSGSQDRLKEAVMSEPAVQAMLDVFPAEIKDVEEM